MSWLNWDLIPGTQGSGAWAPFVLLIDPSVLSSEASLECLLRAGGPGGLYAFAYNLPTSVQMFIRLVLST